MSTLMARTQVALESFPDPSPDLTVIEDFDMVFRLLEHGSLEPVNQVLMLYRLHGTNFSANTEAHRDEVDTWSRMYVPLPHETGIAVSIRAAVRDNYLRATARRELGQGSRRRAFCLVRQMTWGANRMKLTIALLLPKMVLVRLAR